MVKFDGKKYSIEFSLNRLETMLNPDKFFRINRHYIVSIKAISNLFPLSKSKIKDELKPPADEDTVVSLSKISEFTKSVQGEQCRNLLFWGGFFFLLRLVV